MKKNIRAYKWRNRIEEIAQVDNCIGTDVILVDDANAIRANRVICNEPFKLDMSMALIYDKGEAVFKIDMHKYHIKAPAVIIIMINQTCELISYSDDLQGRAIAVSKTFTDSLFIGSNNGYLHQLQLSATNIPIIHLDHDQNVFSSFYQLLKNIAQSPETVIKLEAARHLTLAMFYGYSHMKHDINTELNGTNRQNHIYKEFIRNIKIHYKKERSVEFYAGLQCITSKHLSQVVKQLSNKTALETIDEYVITEIKALLLSTDMNIQEISDTLNFANQSLFGKYFKRIIGLSPKAYRERAESEE